MSDIIVGYDAGMPGGDMAVRATVRRETDGTLTLLSVETRTPSPLARGKEWLARVRKARGDR